MKPTATAIIAVKVVTIFALLSIAPASPAHAQAPPGPAPVASRKPYLDGAKPIEDKAPPVAAAPVSVMKPSIAPVPPAASPTAAASGTVQATAATTAPPSPAAPVTPTVATPPPIIVVTQPAATPPPPANSWGAGLLGLAVLGVGGFYGLKYAQKRGVTVADSLQKLGVEMPQDGISGPGSISHLKPPPPQAAPLPPLPSLAGLPEAATGGSGVAAATVSSATAKRPGAGNFVGTLGPVEGKRLTVPAGAPLTMGRDTDNTLPMPGDTTVSRRHARIEAVPNSASFQIVDEGSSNGTFVNGQRLPAGQARPLAVGDEIQFGASRLRFEG